MKNLNAQNHSQTSSFDRNKYLKILETHGLSQAITALHHDMHQLEHESLEGQKGSNIALWESIKDMRLFSIELWAMRDFPSPHGKKESK